MDMFRKRTLADYTKAAEETGLKKNLTAFDLAALGIGSVVGTGVFVATGAGALKAGPGITLSYILAAIVSGLCALTYSELATMFPVSGSTYSYCYIAFGEIFAWFMGWQLMTVYLISGAAVASGWSGTLVGMLATANINLPESLTTATLKGGIMDLPAVTITILLTWLLYVGVSESAKVNNIIVAIKFTVICLFVVLGSTHINPANYVPFMPHGFSGVVAGTATIFFAYIGFDAVSTAAEETENPARDMPRGLIICMVAIIILYLAVAVTLTGMMPYETIDPSNAIPGALSNIGITWGAQMVGAGAVIGMISTLLVTMYGQVRIFMVMSRDGMLPKIFSEINEKNRTPGKCTIITGAATVLMAGFLPLDRLINISSIGCLAVFAAVSLAILVLRKTMPNAERKFRCPGVPFTPILTIIGALFIMSGFDAATWTDFIVYSIVGLGVYFLYGAKHSTLNKKNVA